MGTTNPTQITHDFPPFFRVHDTGHIERYLDHDFIPPSHDPQTDVVSKDVIISPENQVSARIYLPNTTKPYPNPKPKRPLIVYVHGGAFSIQSAFSSLYHNHLNTVCSKSGYVVVSIEYRLAPENPLPACYDDSWAVLEWVESHYRVGSPDPPDPWLNEFVDFERVFVVGDSAGANIAHNMVIRAGTKGYNGDGFGLRIVSLVLIHPYFGMNGKRIDKMWSFICPDTTGSNDVRYNPGADMGLLSGLGCGKVLVCVAEEDFLRKRGLNYYQTLKKSGWKGEVELFETVGEDHVFHLLDPGCENAMLLLDRVVCFMNNEARIMSRL